MTTTATKPKKRAKVAVAKKVASPAPIKGIKGFNRDLTCQGFQFEPGKSFEVQGKVVACKNGFHSCPLDDDTSPLSVFRYYAPGTSRYFEVEASGETDRNGDKIASAKISIGVEIALGELTRRFIEWVTAKAKPTGAASNSGDCGAAFSHAFGSKVMCEGDGQALYITEFADDGSIKSVACRITGRDGIKAGTWYVCKGGKLAVAA